jgi:hypothetical protein
MRVRWGITVWVLLAAGTVPLRAQFTVTGCPFGLEGGQLNGFTAGMQSTAQICLTASLSAAAGFPAGTYTVTLASALQTAAIGIQIPAETVIMLTVPASFYAAVSNPNQPDPVTVTLAGLNFVTQTGTFQVNPPLLAGGPVVVGGVNSNVSWTLFTGGTPPYSVEGSEGLQGPPGMSFFPTDATPWTGTPTQTGTFPFSFFVNDGWSVSISPTLTAYVVTDPTITSTNPSLALVSASDLALTVNGSGFISPATVANTLEPGSTVTVSQNNQTVSLTPTSATANQLTVTVPASFLATDGYLAVTVVNAGAVTSNQVYLLVDPSITGLIPSSRTAGTSAFALVVTGTGFLPGAVVTMNESQLPTTFGSSTRLTATFPSVSTPGVVTISVFNPDESSTPPTPADLLTILPQPTLASISPSSANPGGPSFQLTATGSHYLPGMTIYLNSVPMPTTFQSAGTLTATIPGGAIASAGTVPVWVATSDGYATPALFFSIVSTTPPLQLLTESPLPPGTVTLQYSFTFMATGGAGGDAFSVIAGALPTGLQLSSSGLLSGIPTAFGGSHFTLQVTDSAGTKAAREYSLNIAPAPLYLTTGALASAIVNVPISIQFAATGGVQPYTFVEFGALPPGTTISSAGLLSGTPTKTGSYPFLLFVDDSAGKSSSLTYTLNVTLPALLVTTASPLTPGQIDLPYTAQLAATGGAGAPYSWAATGLPPGLAITNNGGLIAGIPSATGTFTVAVTLSDASGTMVTQNFTLVIRPPSVTITPAALSNGAVGSSYSVGLSASGGTGSYTFTATGLPPGLTLAASGTLSGIPTTAGAYTVVVTAMDGQGHSGTASYSLTIAPQIIVGAFSLAGAVVGTAITPVKLTATGGTPPYQFQSANPPPGLSVAPDGTVSGTPTAGGTFSFTVLVVDSSGARTQGTVQTAVALPAAPAVTIGGLPDSTPPASQLSVTISLAGPFPAALTANLTLTFVPDSGADDPAVQFASGGRTAQITVPASTTGGLTAVGVQTGTVAGTITITVQLLAGTQDVTPHPPPSRAIRVNAGGPVITSVTATRTSTGFTVVVVGYSSTRDVASASWQFAGTSGANLQTGQLTTTVGSLFSQWYASTDSAPFGSQFSLSQPFTISGNTNSVLSVTVTLTNSIGTSPGVSANLQ